MVERGDTERAGAEATGATSAFSLRGGSGAPASATDALFASGEGKSAGEIASLRHPERVGKYRIVRPLGRGGMGVVYLGRRDEEGFNQLAAIKIVRAGFDSDSELRRFKRERQLLTSLDHPNIARVFDGGETEDGRPYFVMEYVEGQRLDEYCDANGLPVEERLRLFLKVCDAISYCHRNLVVHRDLKPSNILVTRSGEPKVLDFGIAKLLNPEFGPLPDATDASIRPMTLAYASPEQVSGGLLTVASDVYSLGVLLYELLTGRTPYEIRREMLARAAEVICNVEPEAPSTAVSKPYELALADGTTSRVEPETVAKRRGGGEPTRLRRRLTGDLDDVVMIALAKTPTMRYATADELRADLESHLSGKPVEARRRRRSVNWGWYRARRFASRHRFGVGATAAALALLGLGVAGTSWQWAAAAEQRDRARASLEQTRELAGELITTYHDAVVTLPGSIGVRRAFVSGATGHLERLEADAGAEADAALLLDLALGYERLGDVMAGVRAPHTGGETERGRAAELYDRARALVDRAASAGGEGGGDVALARAGLELRRGDLARESGDNAGAARRYRAGLALLAGEDAGGDAVRRTRALLGVALAAVLARDASLAQSESEAEELLAGAEREVRPMARETPTAENRHALARVLQARGDRAMWSGDAESAARLYDAALEVYAELFGSDPTDGWLRRLSASSAVASARAHASAGRAGLALDRLATGEGALRFLVEADPEDRVARRDLALALEERADVLRAGDPAAAIATLSEALRVLEPLRTRDGAASTEQRAEAVMTLQLGMWTAELGRDEGDAGRLRDGLRLSRRSVELLAELERGETGARAEELRDLATRGMLTGIVAYRELSRSGADDETAAAQQAEASRLLGLTRELHMRWVGEPARYDAEPPEDAPAWRRRLQAAADVLIAVAGE